VITRKLAQPARLVISTDSLPLRHKPHRYVLSNPSAGRRISEAYRDLFERRADLRFGYRGNNGAFTSSKLGDAATQDESNLHLANGTMEDNHRAGQHGYSSGAIHRQFLEGDGSPFTVTLVDAGAWRRSPMPSCGWLEDHRKDGLAAALLTVGRRCFHRNRSAARRSSAIRRSSRSGGTAADGRRDEAPAAVR